MLKKLRHLTYATFQDTSLINIMASPSPVLIRRKRPVIVYEESEKTTNTDVSSFNVTSLKDEIDRLSTECSIFDYLMTNLNRIIDGWVSSHMSNASGGKMRGDRGNGIEDFVRDAVNYIGKEMEINLVAKKGDKDKKELKVTCPDGTEIKKQHQVDVHIYLNDKFVAVIECKAYLDSCYYVRACDDFVKFKKFGYNVKNFIFTLEDSIDKDTKIFEDYSSGYICNDIFVVMDGKRSSSKPIYDPTYRKEVNREKLQKFIDFLYSLKDLD